MNDSSFVSIEETLEILKEKAKEPEVSFRDIFQILSGKGRDVILIFLSLPFCQPLQIPGTSTPFGIAIAFFGLRMAFGKHLWLPERLLNKTMSGKNLEKIIDGSLFLIRKIKRFVHPRLTWLSSPISMKILNGVIIAILGIFLALPLPIPLSNLAAAWSIFLIAFGLLENDGLLILIGYGVFAVTLIFFAFVVLFLQHIF